jgi:uncharacterized protein
MTPPSSALSPPTAEAGPIDSSERLELLDTLRGFALCGVFISNVFLWFSGRALLPREQMVEELSNASALNMAAMQLYMQLVAGKFVTLFAFLFGVGFALQLGRAEERGASIVPLYSRRLTVLLMIGLAHLFLLWFGDILTTYAVLGFGLLLLRKRSDRTLLIVALALALLWPIIAMALLRLPLLLAETPEAREALAMATEERSATVKAEALAAFSGTHWWSMVKAGANFYFHDYVPLSLVTVLAIFARLLLGLIAGRRRIFHDVPAHLGLFRRLLGYGLLTAVVSGASVMVFQQLMLRKLLNPETLPPWLPLVMTPMRYLNELGLAAVYVSAITLLFQRAAWQRVLGVLAPVGRMALTNYLSQTVISLFIFYGYGLGMITQLSASACVGLCLAIFAAQVVGSHVWLSRFRFGPVEWVWRSLTYGKAQPMRRDTSSLQPTPAIN